MKNQAAVTLGKMAKGKTSEKKKAASRLNWEKAMKTILERREAKR